MSKADTTDIINMNRRNFIQKISMIVPMTVIGVSTIGFLPRSEDLMVIVQVVDTPNKNNHIYPKHLLEREAKRWTNELIAEGRAFLGSKPPVDGTLNLCNILGQITKMEVSNNALVISIKKLEIIPHSTMMWKCLERGELQVRMGGIGSFTKRIDGKLIINDDYELTSIFVTSDPA